MSDILPPCPTYPPPLPPPAPLLEVREKVLKYNDNYKLLNSITFSVNFVEYSLL